MKGVGQGEVVTVSAGPSTTLEEVGSRMLEELRGRGAEAAGWETHGVRLYLDGSGVEGVHGNACKVADFLCHDRPIPCAVDSLAEERAPANVVVMVQGRPIMLSMDRSDTVGALKSQLSDMRGIPRDEQRLIFAGQQLEDRRTLGSYGVDEVATIVLSRRLKGGARFVDVSATGAEQVHKWNVGAPRWRVALEGLCIEGRCRNEGCDAHDQMVVMNAEFQNFDLILNASDCECPMCRRLVVPIKPGFANCSYRITARKKGSSQLLQVPWTDVRNAYATYNEHVAHVAEWDRMRIFVRPLGSRATDDCAICFDSLDCDTTVHRLPCHHWFHKDCIIQWSGVQAAKQEVPTCPLCRNPFVPPS